MTDSAREAPFPYTTRKPRTQAEVYEMIEELLGECGSTFLSQSGSVITLEFHEPPRGAAHGLGKPPV